MAAIEVVDDRYDDYRALDTPTLIADDFFNAAGVLGAPVAAWRELGLAGVRGRMAINGVEVGTGRGGDILGHPLEALAWLANAVAVRGCCLEAGAFVLLGSVVETRWVAQGDLVEVEIEGLGSARGRFT
jgi:2-keto-4-pentenoate hydratase